MAALTPRKILKATARISAVLICANILFQFARSSGAASDDRQYPNERKRGVTDAASAVAVTAARLLASQRATYRAAAGSLPGVTNAVAAVAPRAAPEKKAVTRTTAKSARGAASGARPAAREEYTERAHSACLTTTVRGANLTCRTAPKRVRIPTRLEDVVESSGRRAAASLAEVDIASSLVFVTGASANHFTESLALIENVQLHHPGRPILYWDVGLTEAQAANVSALCGVAYRKFNFSLFPSHVGSLVTYAFKPLCILQSFEEHRVIWWLDSSVRFRSGDLSLAAAKAREHRGLLKFLGTGHFVFEATHRQMFDYLATDQERLKTTRCAMGGSFIVANTRELFDRVLRWYYWCALDVRCIAPVPRPTACQFSKDHGRYANCHRFDQCVLNILSANMWQFNASMHAIRELNFTVQRGTSSAGSVRYCRGAVRAAPVL